MTNMTPEQRRAMRRGQVERRLATTLSIKDWCVLNKVPESTMYAWMARFRKEEPELFGQPNTSEWVEISRESIAARTALAKRERTAAPAAAASGKAMMELAEALGAGRFCRHRVPERSLRRRTGRSGRAAHRLSAKGDGVAVNPFTAVAFAEIGRTDARATAVWR